MGLQNGVRLSRIWVPFGIHFGFISHLFRYGFLHRFWYRFLIDSGFIFGALGPPFGASWPQLAPQIRQKGEKSMYGSAQGLALFWHCFPLRFRGRFFVDLGWILDLFGWILVPISIRRTPAWGAGRVKLG